VKLFGNVALVGEAIAEAFKIVKGFFPVIELPDPATKFVVPLVLVDYESPFYKVPFGYLPFGVSS
jgi:hypothetical protein